MLETTSPILFFFDSPLADPFAGALRLIARNTLNYGRSPWRILIGMTTISERIALWRACFNLLKLPYPPFLFFMVQRIGCRF